MTTLHSVLNFDGNDFIDLGVKDNFKIPKNITLEAWIYAMGNNAQKWTGIISKVYDTGSTESGYGLTLDGQNGIYFALKTNSHGFQYLSSGANTLKLNEWHHIAGTYDGQTMTVYVDGVAKESKSISDSGIDYDPDNNLSIGVYKDNDEAYYFKGKIAEARIWDKVRTPEEIQADMSYRLKGNEDGLVGYWPLDEGSGETVGDRSANGNNGTIHGATWEQAELPLDRKSSEIRTESVQNILTFDGQGDCIATTLDAQPSALSATTWEAWVKPTRNINRWEPILSTDDGGWDRGVSTNAGRFRIYYGKDAWNAAEVDLDRWQHIAVTYAADKQIKFYKNGTEYIYPGRSSVGSTTNRLHIGRSSGNGSYCFQGSITEVRVWNYVRKPGDIQSNMHHRLKGNEDGLVGYWPLNEGSGETVGDRSASSNNGTIHGATWEQAELPIQEKLAVAVSSSSQLQGTGLADYGYWYHWEKNLPKPTDKKPFRRGRIWA